MSVSDQIHPLVRRHATALSLGAVLGLLAFMPGTDFHFRLLAMVCVFALAAVGLNVLMGHAGVVSLGHAGFFAIGAYAVAIGPARLGLSSWSSLAIGVALAASIAFVIGRPILRLKGHYLAAATLGFGILLFMVLTNEVAWTGGPDGMPVKRLQIGDLRVVGPKVWYVTAAVLLVVGVWLAANLERSPTGRALQAIHGSEVAASVNGVDVARYKLIAFVVSAIYAAIAGAMLALMDGHVTPNVCNFLLSLQLVTMVVLGGIGSILGAVIGAAVLLLLPQFLTALHDYEHAFLGLILILCMIFLRAGIVPTLAALRRRS
ncbi:urea ABC transporter, permease protein [compost metagenome]|uniref:branched-chain amino acid ABC transporter permease n=1 Tax=Polaromonas sp. TaxID=1869339 RepID=UPI00352A434D